MTDKVLAKLKNARMIISLLGVSSEAKAFSSAVGALYLTRNKEDYAIKS